METLMQFFSLNNFFPPQTPRPKRADRTISASAFTVASQAAVHATFPISLLLLFRPSVSLSCKKVRRKDVHGETLAVSSHASQQSCKPAVMQASRVSVFDNHAPFVLISLVAPPTILRPASAHVFVSATSGARPRSPHSVRSDRSGRQTTHSKTRRLTLQLWSASSAEKTERSGTAAVVHS